MAARFVAPTYLRGVFAGAGSDGLNEPAVAAEIVRLAGKPAAAVVVAYLGTATYDLPTPRTRQTARLAEMGCTIVDVSLTDFGRAWPSAAAARDATKAVATADVVVVSGGNTLYAIDQWRALGIDLALDAAMRRGCVLAGGSAGAICWFDGGHSDSADPDTFRVAMRDAAAAAASAAPAAPVDESSAAPPAAAAAKDWTYIRVPGLGFLPGLVCPHYDKVQSNGVLRANDFDGMLRRHAGERGVCIDHWAALVVDGGSYRVLRVPGKGGSLSVPGLPPPPAAVVLDAATAATATFVDGQRGLPGVWLAEIGDDAAPRRWAPADEGLVETLLRPAAGAIVEDAACAVCRARNPLVEA